MLNLYLDPQKEQWPELMKRPTMDLSQLGNLMAEVFAQVNSNGDKALYRYTKTYDGVELESLEVSKDEWEASIEEVPESLKSAIQTAANNIRIFHEQQIATKEIVETTEGVKCWRENRAIESVGLYIPGGSAPLFSTVLMLGVPARIAGCSEIILCTPPNKDGSVHPAILYAAKVAGVQRVFKVGGSQAVAAMALGTESVPKANKLFGPGNQYVTAAKQYAQSLGTAIDMPAGPSEVLVFADGTANPAFIASDLLSQAEHGPDSQVILVSTNMPLLEQVKEAVIKQLEQLPRKGMTAKALEFSRLIFFMDKPTAWKFTNTYAPEHLIIATDEADAEIDQVLNAGSVFLGHFTPESAGDYASGTNHTLPTNGYATAYSGVSLDSFVKKITFQQISKSGIQKLGPTVITMAEAEQLDAHANAVKLRMNG